MTPDNAGGRPLRKRCGRAIAFFRDDTPKAYTGQSTRVNSNTDSRLKFDGLEPSK